MVRAHKSSPVAASTTLISRSWISTIRWGSAEADVAQATGYAQGDGAAAVDDVVPDATVGIAPGGDQSGCLGQRAVEGAGGRPMGQRAMRA